MNRRDWTGLICMAALWLCACVTNLHSNSLKIGVLNVAYDDSFAVEDDPWSWNNGTALLVTGGSLPPGIQLTGSGQLIGTPTQVGDFSFSVTAYTFNNNWWGDDDVYEDSEWYTFFVTEASTNTLCPDPADELTIETYACLGDIEKDNLAAGDAFTLDVNYFVDFNLGQSYDIVTLDFSVFYDEAAFAPVNDSLNSQILREAATRTNASVIFESLPGELHVIVSAQTQNLHKSGRLIDLPFSALTDTPAGAYPFTVVWNGIGQNSTKHALPTVAEIDGLVTVTDGVYEDALADETADAPEEAVDETSEDGSAVEDEDASEETAI